MDNIKTGNLIKEARKAKGMTQKELADILHITDRAISKWERGLSAPDISLLQPLAQALDITLSRLLGGEEDGGQDMETTMKNIIDYSESQIERKTEEKANKTAIVYYAGAITALMLTEIILGEIIIRLSQYAGYEILIRFGFIWPAVIAFAMLIYTAPFWGGALLIHWAVADKKKPVIRLLGISLHMFAMGIILNLSYAAVKDIIRVKERYNHLVTLGGERYEIQEIDWAPRTYDYDTGKYIDNIVYIYDKENPDDETEEYLQGVVSRQPLKIYRLEKQNADHTIWENHIETLPAVMIIREGNINVLEGCDQIALLESKIHTYKQYNIYFY